jgi:hypothetical protein
MVKTVNCLAVIDDGVAMKRFQAGNRSEALGLAILWARESEWSGDGCNVHVKIHDDQDGSTSEHNFSVLNPFHRNRSHS